MAKKEITSKQIKKVFGLILLLFGVFSMLSIFSSFWGVGFLFTYLFGLTGYWVLLPFIIISGLSLFLLGCYPEKPGAKKILLCFTFVFLGLGLIIANLSCNGSESLDSFSRFDITENGDINGFSYFFIEMNMNELAFSLNSSGGVIFYFLSSLLNMVGAYLIYIIASVFMAIGLVILLSEYIGMFFTHLKVNRSVKKSRVKASKEEKKQRAQAQKEEKELQLIYEKYARTEDVHQTLLEEGQQETRLEEPTMSRVKNNLYNSSDNPALPHEIPLGERSSIFLNLGPESMEDTGLVPAGFSLQGQESKATRLEATPAAPAPQVSNPQPPTNSLDSAFFELPKANAAPVVSEPVITPAPVTPTPTSIVSAPSYSSERSFATEPANTPSVNVTPAPVVREEEVAPATPINSFENSFFVPPVKKEVEEEIPANVSPIEPEMEDEIAAEPAVEETHEPELIEIPETVEPPVIKPVVTPAPTPVVEAPVAPAPEPYVEPVKEEPVSVFDKYMEEKKPLPPYELPPVSLLKDPVDNGDKEKLEAEAAQKLIDINNIFHDLSVPCEAISYTIGPSVTRFDLLMAKDAMVSQVSRVMTDLNIRLGGVGARFEQIVPGKTTSGLEVPNSFTSSVSFKEMFLALPDNFDGSKNMYVPIGKGISGNCASADMAAFPHMLVAGTTGSGKSVFVNGMIVALIMRNRPEELKLLMIDPKRVEFSKYREIPHLLCPIIVENSQAKNALNKLCDEMERRFSIFSEVGASNIRAYNEMAEEMNKAKMPFIVCCIDEYADLKLNVKDIDEVVIRLTSKARAAGIHLVLATQRPSADIVSGAVKANLGVQAALKVKDALNSRIILDTEGAESLIGKGDLLINCDQISRTGITRLQGCYVGDPEIMKVVNFIRQQSGPQYADAFMDLRDPEEIQQESQIATAQLHREMKAESDEAKYEEVRRHIMTRDYCSTSYIQRYFGFGFPRSGKIMTRLQKEGVVASSAETAFSNKGCKVLIHSEAELFALLNGDASGE